MGAVHVTVRVSNPEDPERFREGLFLVDTGATDSMVPGAWLREIGIAPRAKREYELADGKIVLLDIGGAAFEFMGDFTFGTVVFGDDATEPILGVTALESVGIDTSADDGTFERRPATRLKSRFAAATTT